MKQVDDHRKTIGITMSRLGREAKVVDGAVVRALYGHRDSEKARLKKHTQDGPGRVHFTTLLAILHALDLDIEIVSRS